MISHGQIDWRIIIIISKEPLKNRSFFELQICYHVFLNTLGVIWHIPNLIKCGSHMRQVTDYKSRSLVDPSLCHNMSVCLWVINTLADSNIMENTQRECVILVKDELRIRWLGYLGVRDRILVNTVIFDLILDISRLIFFWEFPIGHEVRVVIWIVAVHSQLFILQLLETMKLCEHLKLFHIASEWLRFIIVVSTKIYRVWELWIWLNRFLIVIPCLLDFSHIINS